MVHHSIISEEKVYIIRGKVCLMFALQLSKFDHKLLLYRSFSMENSSGR